MRWRNWAKWRARSITCTGRRSEKNTEGDGDLGGEIADVMFSLICLANKHGIDLDKAWEKGMDKRNGRDKNRFARE